MTSPIAVAWASWCVSAGTLTTLVSQGVLTHEQAQSSLDKDLTAFDEITAHLPADDATIAEVRALLMSLMEQVRTVQPPP